ncbi:MAG TPA: 30S ribosomal protein S15 [Nitrospirae bacterium]|nr:30S ribosomal protein S15 [Nitrospirota bacterium]
MPLEKERKQQLVESFRIHERDSGSPEVQIALLTERIVSLTDHFKVHKKDHHSRRGLLKLVAQRKKLINYLRVNDKKRYESVLSRLNLRK